MDPAATGTPAVGTCQVVVADPVADHSEGTSGGPDDIPTLLARSTTPAAPTLVSPNSQVGSQRPTFTWNAASSATWYRLYIRDGSTLFPQLPRVARWVTAASVGCGDGTGTCSWTADLDLAEGSGIRWIHGWNSFGPGPWSAGMSYSILLTASPPTAPTQLGPNSQGGTNRPTFAWNAVADATWYLVFIRDSETQTGAPRVNLWLSAAATNCPAGTGTCSWMAKTDLTDGSAQWWVQARRDGAGAGSWSTAMPFSVSSAPSPPAAPTPVSPNHEVTSPRPTFTWNAVTGSTWYRVFIRDGTTENRAPRVDRWVTAEEVGCENQTGTCSWTADLDFSNGAGTWWSHGWGPDGAGSGRWSTEMTFSKKSPLAPPPAVLVAPSGSTEDRRPDFEWNAVPSATHYRVYIRDASTPGRARIDQEFTAADSNCGAGTETCMFTPGVDLALGRGKWLIRTRNAAGEGRWSASMKFTIIEPTNTAPTAPSIASVTSITQTAATLDGSAFSDPDAGDTHQASEWQVDVAAGDFSTPVVSSGETATFLTTFNASGLDPDTGYQGRVRYQDNHGVWSDWSTPQAFTTLEQLNTAPTAPSIASVTSITQTAATLNGSAFSDPDAGDTHQASEWQVDVAAGDFSTPVATSGETATFLTTFNASGLDPATEYQGRVRYQDNHGVWSDWSSPQPFTTMESPNTAPTLFDFRFDSYSTTNDIHTNSDGLGMSTNHETDVSLDVAEAPPGGPRHSMLYTYPDRTDDAGRCTGRTIRTRAEVPGGVTEMWVELVVKFEDQFTTVAPLSWGCGSAPELKLFFFNHSGAGGGGIAAGRHGMHVGTWGNNTVFLGTPHDHAEFDTVDKSLFDGEWHTFRLHVLLPTVPNSSSSVEDGSGDGRFRMWWNGSLDIDLQNISTSAAQFSELWFGINMNQGQDEPQRLWWNRMRVWREDPGWE